MKKTSELWLYLQPTLQKLIIKLKIAVLVLVVSVTTAFAANVYSNDLKAFESVTELQQRQITGKVTGSDNAPLIGVTVVVKGTTLGTLTDSNGNFSISIPQDAKILSFSFVGMSTQEMEISNQLVFNVRMEEAAIGLDEVVVVGYGTQKKINLTGSVSAVKVDETISSRTLSNVSAGLSGLLPGLAVSQNSGMAGRNDVSMLIRGVGSVNNADPLIVVDGMPDVDINRINMNDIESISVLKDASSAAIYGSRAANGVILITTKTGTGMKETRFNVSSSYASSKPTSKYEGSVMADYPRALTLQNAATGTFTLYSNLLFRDGTIDQWMALGMIDPLRFPNTDWWNVMMRDGQVANINVSAEGGSDNSNFFVSVGVMDEKGMQVGNDYKRYNARFNYDHKLRHNMNIGTRFGGNWTKFDYSGIDGPNTDIFFSIAGITPYDPVSGHFGGVMAYNESAMAYNPYFRYVDDITHRWRQEANTSAYLNWTPLKGLTGRIEYALNYYYQFSKNAAIPMQSWNFQTNDFGSRVFVQENAGASGSMLNGYKTNLNAQLNYNTVINENHDIRALIVYSTEYWYNRSLSGSRQSRLHPSLSEIDAALEEVQSASGDLNTEGLESYIGRFNYVGFGKYLFEANFRYDGSSRFASGRQFGFFPSASIGWIFTKENFISPITDRFLTSGKFRFSYGGLGNNSGVGRYEQKETLETANYIMDQSIVSGFVNSKMINRNLSWETTYVMNVGLDLGFLNNRLSTEFDYYDRLTVDMIRPSDLSLHISGAYVAPRQNIGELRNRGVEGNFTWRDRTGELSYSINFNASYNRNRLEKWNEYLGRGTTFINMPLDFLYIYQDIGIAQSWQDIFNATPQDARPGDLLRVDINGDGQITGEDQKAFPQYSTNRPNTTFGLNSNFAWKGIDLGIFFQGSQGRENIRRNRWWGQVSGINESRYAFSWYQWNNAWNYDNRDGGWPRLTDDKISGSGGNNNLSTNFWLQNLTFIRLKNIQLGYSIPEPAIRKLGIKSLRIYFSGENLLTFTTYKALDDPEKQGDASNIYPILKTATYGINISF